MNHIPDIYKSKKPASILIHTTLFFIDMILNNDDVLLQGC